MLTRLLPVIGDLDAAELAATTDLHLRLDRARVADLLRGSHRLLHGPRRPARRNRDAMTREQLLALIFEQVHADAIYWKGASADLSPRARRAPKCSDPAADAHVALEKWHHGRSMAIPKQITFVTFDVYGTLIDWETGAADAFVKEAARDGFTLDPAEIIPLFHSVQQQIQAGSYELYAEVLRRTAVQIAKDLGWPLEPSRSGFLPDSVQRWPPSRRPTRSSRRSPRSTASA